MTTWADERAAQIVGFNLTGHGPDELRQEISIELKAAVRRVLEMVAEREASIASAVAKELGFDSEWRDGRTSVDSKALLEKYVRHVSVSEGASFIESHYRHTSDVEFTDDEWATLEAIERKVNR